MSAIKPSFSGEVQFRRYSDTSTQGQQIVFAVADREALGPFIGKEGKRFMAVLVEIGDDEQPVQLATPARNGWDEVGPRCREAIDLAGNPAFKRYIAEQGWAGTTAAAGDYIKAEVGMGTRKTLDLSESAYRDFCKRVREPFLAWVKQRQVA